MEEKRSESKLFDKRSVICLCVLFAIQISVILFFGSKKESFFTDEVFSYEGAKNQGISLTYWDNDPSFYGDWHTKAELYDHMTLQKEDVDKMDATSFVELFRSRVLYYLLLNLLERSNIGYLSIWPAIIMNILFILLAETIMYCMTVQTVGDKIMAYIAIFWFALSAGGISVVLYARVYALLILLNVLSFFVLYRFAVCGNSIKRLVYLIIYVLIGMISIKAHQFGMVLFVLTTIGAVLSYALFVNRKCFLVLIPCLLMALFVFRNYIFRANALMDIFWDRVRSFDTGSITAVGDAMAQHLSGSVIILIVFLAGAFICMFLMREKKRVITVLFWQLIVLLGFFFMVIAGNIGASWRYLSPIYLLMCFFLCSCFAGVDSLDKPVIYKTVILFLVLLAVFLTRKNVSELYSGHLEDEAFFEHEYGDMNGLFVVHDKAGENYLYEAAFLWPDESKVYVDKLSVFDETASYDGLFSSDRMLLWTTIDYDYNDVVNRFLEKSKFTDTNEVFVTDTLHVFECYR